MKVQVTVYLGTDAEGKKIKRQLKGLAESAGYSRLTEWMLRTCLGTIPERRASPTTSPAVVRMPVAGRLPGLPPLMPSRAVVPAVRAPRLAPGDRQIAYDIDENTEDPLPTSGSEPGPSGKPGGG